MIQIYNIENTNFDQNGDMSLFPSSASVHAVLNGTWEVTLEHPKDSEDRWKYIKEGAVVKMPSFNGEQLFRITHKEKSESEITADLQPIFMDSKDDCFLMDVRPTNKNGQQALDIMTAPNKKYSAKSNIADINTAYYEKMNLIEALNSDNENSFLKIWGGEIVYDNFTVVIDKKAGSDRGVEILYGKNVAENGMSEEVDMRNVVTRIIPQAYNGQTNKALAEVDGNTITIIPSESFFHAGQNVMQIRVIDGDSKLISFNIIVKCTGKMRFGDEEEEKQTTLVEQLLKRFGNYEAELKDVRKGFAGESYDTAGEAVRKQIESVNQKVDKIETISTKEIDAI